LDVQVHESLLVVGLYEAAQGSHDKDKVLRNLSESVHKEAFKTGEVACWLAGKNRSCIRIVGIAMWIGLNLFRIFIQIK
jgi:hypothetical protein